MYYFMRRGPLMALMQRGLLDCFFAGLEIHAVFDAKGSQKAWWQQWKKSVAMRGREHEYYVSLGELESLGIDIPPDVREQLGGDDYRSYPLPSSLFMTNRRATPHMHIMLFEPPEFRRPRDYDPYKLFVDDLQVQLKQFLLDQKLCFEPAWHLERYGEPDLDMKLTDVVPFLPKSLLDALKYPFKGFACPVAREFLLSQVYYDCAWEDADLTRIWAHLSPWLRPTLDQAERDYWDRFAQNIRQAVEVYEKRGFVAKGSTRIGLEGFDLERSISPDGPGLPQRLSNRLARFCDNVRRRLIDTRARYGHGYVYLPPAPPARYTYTRHLLLEDYVDTLCSPADPLCGEALDLGTHFRQRLQPLQKEAFFGAPPLLILEDRNWLEFRDGELIYLPHPFPSEEDPDGSRHVAQLVQGRVSFPLVTSGPHTKVTVEREFRLPTVDIADASVH